MPDGRVLVTGGSGFIAGHCIIQLLEQGYEVRATVRSLGREPQVRAVLRDAGMVRDDALTFVAADLTSDAGWPEAVDGVQSVLHVASPIHVEHVKDENDVIAPARDGALRVLRAARDAGVERVVLTSALHAVGFGHGRIDTPSPRTTGRRCTDRASTPTVAARSSPSARRGTSSAPRAAGWSW